MNELEPTVEWEDTIIFLAIYYCHRKKKGASYKDIIKKGDAINHAALSYIEVKGGLERLLNSGCIAERGDKFYLNEKIYSEFCSSPSNLESYENVRTFLNPYIDKTPNPKTPEILKNFSEPIYQHALDQAQRSTELEFVSIKLSFYLIIIGLIVFIIYLIFF